MDSAAASPEADASARRRSGRVVRAPSKYAPDPATPSSAKRKRMDEDGGDEVEGDEAEDEMMAMDEGLSDVPSDAHSDDDHPAPRQRKPPQPSRPKKSSLKKPKINGTHPAVSGNVARIPSRPKPRVRIDTGDKKTGLFADIFGSGDSSQSIANQWLEAYRADNANAMRDLVNCILQCAGCDLEVSADDIGDPDNIPNRLRDLQSVYQEQHIVDYPLIARAKSTRSFRDLLVTFFRALVALLHETDLMYKDQDLMDNLHSWLASMSSSALRPFRHTATTISLTVQSGLVEVANTLDRRIANIEQQAQAVNRGKNKERAAIIERNLAEANGYRKICSLSIQSFFDVIFVHRYRDIDSKIRVECVEALGKWIWDLPTVFMEPGYLRYLGWMLSDTNPTVRQEVLKQLLRVFKRDAERLGHFIDRFRPRLVEMATLDSEVSVRAAAISVIDCLRAAALLEPNEIDAIGKLIFDTEVRIRKAVAGFFFACTQDVREGKVEEMGGSEALDELLSGSLRKDYEQPRVEWLNIKCLAETLAIYDAQIEGSEQDGGALGLDPGSDIAADLLDGTTADTRISLASQALHDLVPELKSWQILAGYLLYDHTTSVKSSKSKSKAKGGSVEEEFMGAVAPTPAEEAILLDVLSSAAKTSLQQAAEHEKGRRKAARSEAAETQEDVALGLARRIPKLLSKYGAEPETAAIVLGLEHLINLDVFLHMGQDSTGYERLLNEIATQFNRHDDKRVLSEVATAILHARQYRELEELADSKLTHLWQTVIHHLRSFDRACELSIRGNLEEARLRELSTVLMKMGKLASISDCVKVFESVPVSQDSSSTACQMLVNIVHRGKFEPQDEEGIDGLEDEVVSLAIKACQFYFMWKTRAVSQQISAGGGLSSEQLVQLSVLRQTYRKHLIETFSSRAMIDHLRLFATGSLIDLHLTFATLRRPLKDARPSTSDSSSSQPSMDGQYKVLLQAMESGLVPELTSIFDGAERQYAKKAKKDKTLNEPAEDEEPVADDEEEEDESEDEDDGGGISKAGRYAAELKAEKALCEITAKYVLAITGKVMDKDDAAKLRRRLERNETKLGNNYKEIVAYLDEEKMAKRSRKPKPATPSKPQKQQPALSAEVVEDEDDDDEGIFDHADAEEGSREDLQRRGLLDDLSEDDEDAAKGSNHEDKDNDSVLGD